MLIVTSVGRQAVCGLALTLLSFGLALFMAPTIAATGGPSHPIAASAAICQDIVFNRRHYVFYRDRIRCRKAKRLAHKLHRTKYLNGWNCTSGSNFASGAYCKKGRRIFGWHPYD